MARLEHLQLVRLLERFERRKRQGFSKATARAPGEHSAKLSSELDVAVAKQRQRRRATVYPSLILRVQMSENVADSEWEKLGLTVLSVDKQKNRLVVAVIEKQRPKITLQTILL